MSGTTDLTETADPTGPRWLAAIAAVGAGATTFLLIAVPVIALLDIEFSALVALPLGLLAGLGALVGVGYNFGTLHPVRRRAVVAYAAFGPAVFLVLGLAYVNVAPSLLTPEVAAGVGLAATAAVYAWLGLADGEPGP